MDQPAMAVDDALEFLKPAEVHRLEEEGRTVVRQGDVYLVEMKRSSNFQDTACHGNIHS